MGLNNYSSGYSSGSNTPWNGGSWSDFQTPLQPSPMSGRNRSLSFAEHAVTSPTSIDAIMEEFRMNGSDSPYDPDEDCKNRNPYSAALIGMGPSGVYLRQKSWPAPEASPTVPLPSLGVADDYRRRSAEIPDDYRRRSVEIPDDYRRRSAEIADEYRRGSGENMVSAETASEVMIERLPFISKQQLQVLSTLPNAVLYYLLKKLEQTRGLDTAERQKESVECRFCKNNGELESRYRSHRLRWQGRIVCPVLRAYRCRRCGAEGDAAHTLKYCPLTTVDERRELANRMRSVHNRRRGFQAMSAELRGEDLVYGQTNIPTGAVYHQEPLDPIWEALANKLM